MFTLKQKKNKIGELYSSGVIQSWSLSPVYTRGGSHTSCLTVPEHFRKYPPLQVPRVSCLSSAECEVLGFLAGGVGLGVFNKLPDDANVHPG